MATPVIMPRQGQSVESCIISKWFKQKGDRVTPGEILFAYETDKAAFEEEAQTEGILLEVFFFEGDDVPVLTNVCVIGAEGEDISPFMPGIAAASVGDASNKSEGGRTAAAAQTATPEESQDPSESGKSEQPTLSEEAKISPRARNLAGRSGVDPRLAVPTGPEGRIIERDIAALIVKGPKWTPAARAAHSDMDGSALQGTGLGGRVTTRDVAGAQKLSDTVSAAPPAASAEYTEVKLSNIRKVIARAMHQSLTTTAQLTLNTSFDAANILMYRKALKAGGEALGLSNITLNDIVLFAAAKMLLKHPKLNAHLLEDTMHVYSTVHLGIAVDTERGLMVPTMRHADRMSLNELALEVKGLAKGCQEGSINPDLLKGGTFTVTNLGALGIESFTPVLNPPQTGILGVNTIVYRQREAGSGFETYPAMGLSLTFDHRAVDGAPAARFLKDLKLYLENFSVLLAL